MSIYDEAGKSDVTSIFGWNKSSSGKMKLFMKTKRGRSKDEKYYRNTVTHEFGHVLGIDDGYDEGFRPLAKMLNEYDIMVDVDVDMRISSIDIQMLVLAFSTNKYQYFMTYLNHKQSEGTKKYEECESD